MATLTIRKVPDTLYEKLRTRAAENRRSINSEVIALLDSALSRRRRDAESVIREAEELDRKIGRKLPDLITGAKREGRL